MEGTASFPTTVPWAPNPDGPRTLAQAIAFVESRGVSILDEVEFHVVEDDALPAHVHASYSSPADGALRVEWEDFKGLREKILVRVKRSVLNSDEAILAVISHEMHELNTLDELFAVRKTMPGTEVARLITAKYGGTLHKEAWDVSDMLVKRLRSDRKKP